MKRVLLSIIILLCAAALVKCESSDGGGGGSDVLGTGSPYAGQWTNFLTVYCSSTGFSNYDVDNSGNFGTGGPARNITGQISNSGGLTGTYGGSLCTGTITGSCASTSFCSGTITGSAGNESFTMNR